MPERLASELEKRLHFVSQDIASYRLVREGGAVEAIDITLAAGAGDRYSTDERHPLGEKIDRLVERDVLAQRHMAPKVVWRSAAPPRAFEDAYESLRRDGAVFECGEGQIGFGAPLIGLLDHLDARVRAIALAAEGAREFRYPTLLPTRVLERFRYFASFPQYVLFVTRLHSDLDVYDAFARDFAEHGTLQPDLFSHCENHDYCLPPTMCYHTYHQHSGRVFDADCTVTSRGKSFRFESKYHAGPKRLWDFTIREIVFLGRPEYVQAQAKWFMEQSFALVDELGLAGSCEVANDHFFAGADTVGKIFSQRLMELKYELRLGVEGGESIAVASFNQHGQFFGDAFDMRLPAGQAASTSCVGFGLERLVYAFVCQHGPKPAAWPASVRRAVVGS